MISFDISRELEIFISFNNLLLTHPLMVHIPSICFNFLSSNNCNLKLSWTLGLATIIIFLLIPICIKYSRISSQTPIAEQVFPDPNPWNNNKLLYGVWNDKKFLTNACWGKSPYSILLISFAYFLTSAIMPSYFVSLNSFFFAILIKKFGSSKDGYK